jgi:hypothetical protein
MPLPDDQSTQSNSSSDHCPSPRGGSSSHVRFTEKEYERIRGEASLRGLSIPQLLKRCYFQGAPAAPIVAHENARAIVGELRRIGTNINQIARQLNAQSAADDVQRVIAEAVEYLRSLRITLGGTDGAR